MSKKSYTLNRARKRKNNEFYTTEIQSEYCYSHIKQFLKNKVVYLPCDTENSELVKTLLRHKDENNIKDIIWTSDNYYGHLDLYEKADIIYTNPPFTGLNKWIDFLNNTVKKDFIIFAGAMTLWSDIIIKKTYCCLSSRKVSWGDSNKNIYSLFKTDKNEYKGIGFYLITNNKDYRLRYYFEDEDLLSEDFYKHKLKENLENGKNYYFNDMLWCDKNYSYSPIDYNNEFVIGNLAAFMYGNFVFDIIEHKIMICKDGKMRPRTIVKWNKEFYKKLQNK